MGHPHQHPQRQRPRRAQLAHPNGPASNAICASQCRVLIQASSPRHLTMQQLPFTSGQTTTSRGGLTPPSNCPCRAYALPLVPRGVSPRRAGREKEKNRASSTGKQVLSYAGSVWRGARGGSQSSGISSLTIIDAGMRAGGVGSPRRAAARPVTHAPTPHTRARR